jgi:hypothetical protein
LLGILRLTVMVTKRPVSGLPQLLALSKITTLRRILHRIFGFDFHACFALSLRYIRMMFEFALTLLVEGKAAIE